jgi:hypothetical protein
MAPLNPTSTPHRTAIKWLFAIVVACQPLQYAFIAAVGEPYPAITMPTFAGVPADANGVIHITNVDVNVLLEDNSVVTTSLHALFAKAPVSHHFAIVYHMFRPQTEAKTQSVGNGLKQRIKKALFPGAAVNRERSGGTVADKRTVRWLKTQFRALYPNRQPKSVTFVWYNEKHRLNGPPEEQTKEVTGSYEVPLDGIQ